MTKQITFQDTGRSTVDTGENRVVRGIDDLIPQEIQVQGELKEFVSTIKVLEDYPELQSIHLHISKLPTADGKRKFSYLDDGVTNRQYALATLNLFDGRQYRTVKVERESRLLSMLIFFIGFIIRLV